MRKRIFKNWGLKLASLLLAFILWFLVVQIEDPIGNKTFNNITVRLVNTELLENENKVYEVLDGTDTVDVTVSAPNSIREQLRAADIVAEADISKLKACTGWEQKITLEETIQDTLEYWRQKLKK